MSRFALDSSALLSWVLNEGKRGTAVDALLSHGASEPILPAPALTEVLSIARRRRHGSSSDFLLHVIAARGIRSELLTEVDMVRAAHLQQSSEEHPWAQTGSGETKTLSLADSLILAIVERLDVPVLTHDHYWRDFADEGLTRARILVL